MLVSLFSKNKVVPPPFAFASELGGLVRMSLRPPDCALIFRTIFGAHTEDSLFTSLQLFDATRRKFARGFARFRTLCMCPVC